MKKTLVALAVAAFATTSASATTIITQKGDDGSESEVKVGGNVKFLLQKNTTRAGTTRVTGHTYLANDGSDIKFEMKHTSASGVYAKAEIAANLTGAPLAQSFNTTSQNLEVNSQLQTDGLGNLRATSAFVALGSKDLNSEVLFGRHGSIVDIFQADVAKQFDNFDGLLSAGGRSVVRYQYTGSGDLEGLTFSAGYRFAEQRVNPDQGGLRVLQGEVAQDTLQAGYGTSVKYERKEGDDTVFAVGFGYTRDDNFTGTTTKDIRNAFGFGAKYALDKLTLGVDYATAYQNRVSDNNFRLGAEFKLDKGITVSSTYSYLINKENSVRTVTDGITLGSSYEVTKGVEAYAVLGHSTVRVGTGSRVRTINTGVGLTVKF